MTKWLLVETFGGANADPTVIGHGTSPRKFVPLRTVLKGRSLNETQNAMTESRRTGKIVDVAAAGRHVIAVPLHTFAGNLHGFWIWAAADSETIPDSDPAGAWQFNLTTNRISGSDDLLDLYGVPRDGDRQSERNTAEAFGRLVTNADEAAAMAKMVRAAPGTEHQATWTVRRDDDQLRAAHFSARMIAETTADGDQVVMRGITEDIGATATTPAAPPPTILAAQVLAATAEPGTYRCVLNLRTLQLIRWLDSDQPMPGIAWEYDAADNVDHWIHPDDMAKARAMTAQLIRGRAEAKLRFRTIDHDWRPVHVTVNPFLLDEHTTAGLLTMHDAALVN